MTSAPAELLAACRALPDPASYYLGSTPATGALPGNIVAFHRRLLGPTHVHDTQHHRFVLIVSLRTGGELCLNERLLRLSEGQACLVFPHQLHHYLVIGVPLDWLYITFECPEPGLYLPLRHRPVPCTEPVWTLLGWFFAAYRGPGQERRLALTLGLLLDELVARAAAAAPAGPEDAAPVGHTLVLERVNRYVHAHLNRPLGLREVARAVGLSPSRLGALFRRQMGISPARYLRRVRVNIAARLLHETTLSVREVAARTGFASLPAFSRTFRQVLGEAPTAYRHRR